MPGVLPTQPHARKEDCSPQKEKDQEPSQNPETSGSSVRAEGGGSCPLQRLPEERPQGGQRNRHADVTAYSDRQLSDKPKCLLVPEVLAVAGHSPEEEEWTKKGEGNQDQDRLVAHPRLLTVPEEPAYPLARQQRELSHLPELPRDLARPVLPPCSPACLPSAPVLQHRGAC